jgi:hypothetical protein
VALLTAQQTLITGTTPNYVAVSATDTINPDDSTFLIVRNANAAADTCTVVVPGTYVGQAIPDVAVSVPATTGERWIGPLAQYLADPVTGLVSVTHSVTASVTCALVRVA